MHAELVIGIGLPIYHSLSHRFRVRAFQVPLARSEKNAASTRVIDACYRLCGSGIGAGLSYCAIAFGLELAFQGRSVVVGGLIRLGVAILSIASAAHDRIGIGIGLPMYRSRSQVGI